MWEIVYRSKCMQAVVKYDIIGLEQFHLDPDISNLRKSIAKFMDPGTHRVYICLTGDDS